MNNTFLIAYAIAMFTMAGLIGTIDAKTMAAKVVGFVGMFLALPALGGVVAIAVYLDEHSGNGWASLLAMVMGIGLFVAFGGVMVRTQDRLDNRAKKA